jgi:tryptophanyl-tRNA synthetase
MLADALETQLAGPLERYRELMASRSQVDEILAEGSSRARTIARATLGRVKEAVGLA